MQSCIIFARNGLKFLNLASSRRAVSNLTGAAVIFAILFAAAPALAAGGTTVVAKYDLRIAGIALADFTISGDYNDVGYTISAHGKSSKLVALVAKFKGLTRSAGAFAGAHIVPASYELNFKSGKRAQSVAMHFSDGAIDKLAVNPKLSPSSNRIPVEPAHRVGVLDPLSAIILPLPEGEIDGQLACTRHLPLFDGRHRYDLVLSYKRTEYAPAAGKSNQRARLFVCKVKYNPIAGHKPNRKSTVYWQTSEKIEIQLVAVPRAGLLIPYRVSLPTPVGTAILSLSKLAISKDRQQAAISPAK